MDREKKLLLIVNPKSGKGLVKSHLLYIADLFTKAGMEITLHITQRPHDAGEVVTECGADYDVVVCCGGDGTLDEVVNAMMVCEERRPIGYIPAGSTNDFAKSLQIPRQMNEAAQCIVDGRTYLCDVGSFNGDYFVYVAAFGIFTDVSYQTNQDMKNLLGHLAYVLEGAKRIFNVKSYHMEVEACGEHIEDDFIYGMITNSKSVGGFRNITGKNVQLNDGLLEVTLIRMPRSATELQEIIASLLSREMDSKYIYTCKTDTLTLHSALPVSWTLDGEFGGDHSQVSICCCRQALPIFVKEN